jgi:hypothetical protein
MSEPDPYYNTTGLGDEALAERIAQAETQEERIRLYFEARPQLHLTPFEIQEKVLPQTPVTSVRRAITNLTEQGTLRKTDHMKDGRYGQPNHTWTLAAGEGEQIALFTQTPENSPSQSHDQPHE